MGDEVHGARNEVAARASRRQNAFFCAFCLLPFALIHAAQADRPVPRTDRNSQIAHEQLLDKARRGRIDVYFAGDSITRRWGATDYPELLANWRQNFFGWNAANFGWGADGVEHMLWRIENGELDGVNPKVVVLMIGTNNVGFAPPPILRRAWQEPELRAFLGRAASLPRPPTGISPAVR